MNRLVLLAATAIVTSGPAFAGEATGKVSAVDETAQMLTLDTGGSFRLPGEFDYSALQVGMDVIVVYDETGDGNVVTDIELAE